jgi:hypothetical protein
LRLGLVLLVVSTAACVVRTERSEHYLGPVLVRATDGCRGSATAVQSIHAGVFGELGTQTGVALGMAKRVALTPLTDEPTSTRCDHWRAIGAFPGEIGPDHWTFSPLYARRETSTPPEFVWRLLVGAQATGGKELSALSVGAVSRSALRPQADGFYVLHFDSTRPMAARFKAWSLRSGSSLPADQIMEEVRDDVTP